MLSWPGSSMVQVMVCCLFGTKPFTITNVDLSSIWPLRNKLPQNLNQNTIFVLQENTVPVENLSAICQAFYTHLIIIKFNIEYIISSSVLSFALKCKCGNQGTYINSPPKVLSLTENVSYLSTQKTFQHSIYRAYYSYCFLDYFLDIKWYWSRMMA